MRVAFCADVHAGNHRRFGGPVTASLNERCRLVLRSLALAHETAREADCTLFIVLGDLFDTARPEPQLIEEVQRIFQSGKEEMETCVLMGNHEQVSMSPNDHALGPLQAQALVVSSPVLRTNRDLELFLIPFRPGKASDWLPDAVRKFAESHDHSRRILGIHMGIRDEKTAPWLQAAPDSIDVRLLANICREHNIQHVFAGNWHDRRRWGSVNTSPRIFQLGALVPTGWDNPGLDGYGTLAIYDSDMNNIEVREIPGPRFLKAIDRNEATAAAIQAKKRGFPLYVSLVSEPENVGEDVQHLEAGREKGDFAAVEVLPDKVMAARQAQKGASAARSAGTLEEALSSFVAKMQVPDGVSRDSVLARARRYLT